MQKQIMSRSPTPNWISQLKQLQSFKTTDNKEFN